MVGMAKLDFGKSMWTDRPVMEEIAIRLELSLEVAILATIVAVLIAVPLGTLAALFRDTWIDYLMRIITIGGLSIPSFWFGMLIMLEPAGASSTGCRRSPSRRSMSIRSPTSPS